MKRTPTVFLQAVLVLIGLVVLFLLIRLPMLEGRAVDLDIVSIYADPFILYGYTASIAFFIALYKAFRLLGYIGQNKVFSAEAVGTLKSIKYCALILTMMIVLAGIYVRIFHADDDDPAGFMALCIVASFASVVVGTAAAVIEKVLQNAIDMKAENDLTI